MRSAIADQFEVATTRIAGEIETPQLVEGRLKANCHRNVLLVLGCDHAVASVTGRVFRRPDFRRNLPVRPSRFPPVMKSYSCQSPHSPPMRTATSSIQVSQRS